MYGVRQFWASTVRPYVRYVIVRKIRTCTAFGLSLPQGTRYIVPGDPHQKRVSSLCFPRLIMFHEFNIFELTFWVDFMIYFGCLQAAL